MFGFCGFHLFIWTLKLYSSRNNKTLTSSLTATPECEWVVASPQIKISVRNRFIGNRKYRKSCLQIFIWKGIQPCECLSSEKHLWWGGRESEREKQICRLTDVFFHPRIKHARHKRFNYSSRHRASLENIYVTSNFIIIQNFLSHRKPFSAHHSICIIRSLPLITRILFAAKITKTPTQTEPNGLLGELCG